MGSQDRINHSNCRKPGCVCAYCIIGDKNWLGEYDYSSNPAPGAIRPVIRSLKDGEIQYIDKSDPNHFKAWVGPPGCSPYNPYQSAVSKNGWIVQKNRAPQGQSVTFGPTVQASTDVHMSPPGGVTCSKCRLKNEYGAPNQPGGGYICYECRR